MRILCVVICLGLYCKTSCAQIEERIITLQEALQIALDQSQEAKEAMNNLEIASWMYRNYKATLLPNVIMEGTLPSLNKSLNTYQSEDGSYHFVPNRSISENLSLSVTQNIPQTGGRISIGTELMRMDQIGQKNTMSYLANPAILTLIQPVLSFNELKWSRKIEPIKYNAAKKQYIVDMESVCLLTVNHYFNLLISMINQNIAEHNLKNSTALYHIALEKRKLGLVSDNDLQQLKLGKLNASATMQETTQNYKEKMYILRNFLGFSDNVELKPLVPKDIPNFKIEYDKVLEIVQRNNPFSDNIKRRLIEAARQIALAQSERGFKLDVYASIGFTGSNKQLPDAYKNLQNRQVVTVGIRVPLLDWGTGRGKIELAQSKQKIEKGNIEQEKRNFEQEIKMLVLRLQNHHFLMDAYKQADTVAQNRYKVAFEMFVMGRITVLDINAAQVEEAQARRNYINQLYYSWYYFYRLRQFTLYDFVKQKDIINNLSEPVWTKKYRPK